MGRSLTVVSPQELAEEIVRCARQLNRKDFSKIGSAYVYNEPLKASRSLFLIGNRIYRAEDGYPFVGLNLPEQLLVLKLLSEKTGIQLRHGGLQENLSAAYSPDGQSYKRNVLEPFSVYTGEMIRRYGEKIRRYGDDCRVGKVKDVKILPVDISDDYAVFEGESSEKLRRSIARYNLGPVLQTEIPTRHGYFSQFKGIIPVDSELKPERGKDGKGYWYGITSVDTLSIVMCNWYSERGLNAGAHNLSTSNKYCALGIWTDAL